MKARKSVFDWQPWMTVALTLSGLLAVAAWAGPRSAYAGLPQNPKK